MAKKKAEVVVAVDVDEVLVDLVYVGDVEPLKVHLEDGSRKWIRRGETLTEKESRAEAREAMEGHLWNRVDAVAAAESTDTTDTPEAPAVVDEAGTGSPGQDGE